MVTIGRRLILILLLAAWAGAVFLSSPPRPGRDDPDKRPWPTHSTLRTLLDGLGLNYALPTDPPEQVKSLALRGGATLMAVVALICWGLNARTGAAPTGRPASAPEEVSTDERDALLDSPQPPPGRPAWLGRPIPWRHPGPLGWGLLVLLGAVAWAAASAGWSHAPRQAVAAAEALAFPIAIAVIVAASLDRRLVRAAVGMFLALAAALAGLGLWYHFARAPRLPLGVVVGDSRELAGVLLPAAVAALVLAGGRVAEVAYPAGRGRPWGRLLGAAALVAVAALVAWAIRWCTTGAALGALLAAVAGVTGSAVLLTRGRWRLLWLAGGVAALAACGWWAAGRDGAGRPPALSANDPAALAAVRFDDDPLIDRDRWSMAAELWRASPVIGRGGGGYRTLADELARRRALADPRWSDRQVGSARSAYLEQLADYGLVGLALAMSAGVLVLVGAARAVRRCPWRSHRYLLAALGGGLIALAVHELFAGSAYRPAFACVLAGWSGLTAAAARWSSRPLDGEPGGAAYRWQFYAGGLTFLVGAAVVSLSLGYLVAADWRAGRLTWEAIADAAGPSAEQQLAQARRWAVDPPRRFEAAWLWTRVRIARVHADIVRSARTRQPDQPVPPPITGQWEQELIEGALPEQERLRTDHPGHPARIGEWEARVWLLAARGRVQSLSVDQAQGGMIVPPLLASRVLLLVTAARQSLDAQLAETPHELSAALLRESLSDDRGLAGEIRLPWPQAAGQLVARAGLGLDRAARGRLLRDGLRDSGLIGSAPAGWSGGGWVVERGDFLPMPPRFYDALTRLLGPLPAPGQVERMLRPAEIAPMLRAAESAEAAAPARWIDDPDADVREAPQTFRLLAELDLLGNFLLRRAGLAGPSALPDLPARAEGLLARAGRLYDQDPARFALGRVIVGLARAQLAWHAGGGRATPAALARLAEACDALPQVDPIHRGAAERAVAIVAAFLLAEVGRTEEAMAWFDRAEVPAGDLATFRGQTAEAWRAWLSPPSFPPVPSTQPATTQPAASQPNEFDSR